MTTVTTVHDDAVERVLTTAHWQRELHAEEPSRAGLAALRATWAVSPIRIRVHRNHAFEHVADATGPWLAMWRKRGEWQYGEYDDSFAFGDTGHDAAVEILWIDFARYSLSFREGEALNWLAGRLVELRTRTAAGVLVIPVGAPDALLAALPQLIRAHPGVRFADLEPIRRRLAHRFFDERASRHSGTRLSNAASVAIARELSCRWLPALLRPRLKAIALDLDHTLYDGVLGEEGNGVTLTEAHAALQRKLVHLRDDGLYLALVTRNDPGDVRGLFEARGDFPLQWRHFSAVAASWGSKAGALRRIASDLRIGTDALLLVDDNPGELAAVAAELDEIATVHAEPDAAGTCRALEHVPGLWAWDRSPEDALRVADLAAATQRAALAVASRDSVGYLRSLQARLRVETNPRPLSARLQELSNKTNQFNLALARLSEVQVAAAMLVSERCIVALSLADRLADSGVIGVIAARRCDGVLLVEDLAISCRALGRGLEDFMIAQGVQAALHRLPAVQVAFVHRTGPRNGPARTWLARFTGSALAPEGIVLRNTASFATRLEIPVTVEVRHHEPSGS